MFKKLFKKKEKNHYYIFYIRNKSHSVLDSLFDELTKEGFKIKDKMFTLGINNMSLIGPSSDYELMFKLIGDIYDEKKIRVYLYNNGFSYKYFEL